MMKLFHGGIPGLHVGDLIEPGHHRPTHWEAADLKHFGMARFIQDSLANRGAAA